MLSRDATGILRQLARTFPAVVVTGPRQSGKTTLVRSTFGNLPYVNLEDPDQRAVAVQDPRGFLAHHAAGAILDEVQRAPTLLSYLQGILDESPARGRFVLTGSQQFGLLDGVTQSLAGRVGLLTLLPLSQPELDAARRPSVRRAAVPGSLDERLWRGSYPALHVRQGSAEPAHWLAAYVSTYVERDVRQMLNVGNLLTFQRFVQMCAARSGQLLNLNALASDCGISHPTARQWLTVLQASYLVTLLPPYHRNFGKRLVKMPKLYFLDSGLLCYLLQIRTPAELFAHSMRGPVFEAWVISETLKYRYNRGLPADICFWRDNHGLEVDLVFEHTGRLHAVEIKSGATFSPDWIAAASRWQGLAGDKAAPPMIVYGGDASFEYRGHPVLSWQSIGQRSGAGGASPEP